MEKLVENEKLLTEFAKAIYRNLEKYVNEHDNNDKEITIDDK